MTSTQLTAALYVLAYLLAVADGTMQSTAIRVGPGGRVGLILYCWRHPLIVLGGMCGIVASVIPAL